jgi:subfamily B ATP-binding cassette protein HlyB/CyaB
MDSGLYSLLTIAEFHGIAADDAKLRHEFGQAPFSVETIICTVLLKS